MITLGCEALFEGKTKLFFRTPEDHLHPKAERRIISMFQKMQELLAPNEKGGVGTLVEEPKEPKEPEPPKTKKPRKKKDK
jgi:hypothetical protein